ncbi:MAG: DUF222 domain-containing protein, partial [bacterium]|nr:DUF222 domain-containing protein [bacterium]
MTDPTLIASSDAAAQGAPVADSAVVSGSDAVGRLGGVGQGAPVADSAVVSGSDAVGRLGGVGQGAPVVDPILTPRNDNTGRPSALGQHAPVVDPILTPRNDNTGRPSGVGQGAPVVDPILTPRNDNTGRPSALGQHAPVTNPTLTPRSDDTAGGSAVSVCGCGGVSASGAGGDPEVWLSAVLGVLREGLGSLGGDRLDERLGLVGRVESAAAALRSETVAAIAGRRGEAEAAAAVRDRLRESRGKAKRDVLLAGRLEWLPDTAEALAGGAITARQAQLIAEAAEAAEEASIDETELLAAAAEQPADRFGRTVRDHLNERTAGEGLEQRRRRQRERREFSIRAQADGMFRLSGWLDPLAGARVQTALGAEYRRLLKAEDHKNPKKRATTAQLYADALESLLTRSGRGKAPRTSLVVVADYDFVADQLANPRLYDGTPLAADEFVKIALEADILPALFDTDGQPLWLGRAVRDATDAQRIALAVRDKGCVGCGAPNSYC